MYVPGTLGQTLCPFISTSAYHPLTLKGAQATFESHAHAHQHSKTRNMAIIEEIIEDEPVHQTKAAERASPSSATSTLPTNTNATKISHSDITTPTAKLELSEDEVRIGFSAVSMSPTKAHRD